MIKRKYLQQQIIELFERKQWKPIKKIIQKERLKSLSELNDDHFDILIYAIEHWGNQEKLLKKRNNNNNNKSNNNNNKISREVIKYILDHSSYTTLNYAFYDYKEHGEQRSPYNYYDEIDNSEEMDINSNDYNENNNNKCDDVDISCSGHSFTEMNESTPITQLSTPPLSNSITEMEMESGDIQQNNNTSSLASSITRSRPLVSTSTSTSTLIGTTSIRSKFYGLYKVPLFSCIVMENYEVADYLLNYGQDNKRNQRTKSSPLENENDSINNDTLDTEDTFDTNMDLNSNSNRDSKFKQWNSDWKSGRERAPDIEIESARIDYVIPEYYVMTTSFQRSYNFGDGIHYLNSVGLLTGSRLQYILSRGFPIGMMNTNVLQDLVHDAMSKPYYYYINNNNNNNLNNDNNNYNNNLNNDNNNYNNNLNNDDNNYNNYNNNCKNSSSSSSSSSNINNSTPNHIGWYKSGKRRRCTSPQHMKLIRMIISKYIYDRNFILSLLLFHYWGGRPLSKEELEKRLQKETEKIRVRRSLYQEIIERGHEDLLRLFQNYDIKIK